MELREIISYIAPVATALLGMGLGKTMEKAKAKKINAEAEGQHISNVEDTIGIWQNIVTRLEKEVEDLRSRVFSLEQENRQLHRELAELRQ